MSLTDQLGSLSRRWQREAVKQADLVSSSSAAPAGSGFPPHYLCLSGGVAAGQRQCCPATSTRADAPARFFLPAAATTQGGRLLCGQHRHMPQLWRCLCYLAVCNTHTHTHTRPLNEYQAAEHWQARAEEPSAKVSAAGSGRIITSTSWIVTPLIAAV